MKQRLLTYNIYKHAHANIRAPQVSLMQDKDSKGYKEAVGSHQLNLELNPLTPILTVTMTT